MAMAKGGSSHLPMRSRTVEGVPASGIRRIFELSGRMEDVIQLSVGEPTLSVAPHVLRAAADAWMRDDTGYMPNSGIMPLREAIVEEVRSMTGVELGTDRVHVTAGGSQALHMAMLFTLDPGDEVLVPDPGYSTFWMASRLVGARPVSYPLRPERGFVPDVGDLESLVTPRTRAVLVNSPSNPLGVVLDRDRMGGLLAFARRHGLWVISDEVYEHLTFSGVPVSPLSLDPDDRVFAVHSFSKTYGLTGGRIGYLVTPPDMEERFRAAQEATVSCVNTPVQWAALAALRGPQDYLEGARAHFRGNVEAALAALEKAGLRHVRPGGAFYLWVDVSHASRGDVASWAEEFLVRQRVAVAPGSAFGSRGEGWIRLCAAGGRGELLEAIARLPRP